MNDLFDKTSLLLPYSGAFTLLDFSQAMMSRFHGFDEALSPASREISEKILSGQEHFVLLLVDGMGKDQLSLLPNESILRKNCHWELQSVFPSSTAPAITTLVTARSPAEHAVLAWWMKIESMDIDIEILPFQERKSHKPLEELGLEIESLCPRRSRFADLDTSVLSIVPEEFIDSSFSLYSRGSTEALGYEALSEAFDGIIDHAGYCRDRSLSSSFTYCYIPDYDKTCHEKGVGSQESLDLLKEIERQIKRLLPKLPQSFRLLVLADHGQIDVPEGGRLSISRDSRLYGCLQSDPSGEPSVPFFHIHPEKRDEFLSLWERDFASAFQLISCEEVESLGLLGPGEYSPMLKSRLGDYIGISKDGSIFTVKDKRSFPFIGIHGGVSHQEMMVPLIVFDS